MRFRDILGTGLSNLRRRKLRTFLTAVGVWVGILTVVTMVSLGIGLQTQITDIIKQWGLETVFVTPNYDQPSVGRNFNPTARPRPTHPVRPTDVAAFANLPGVRAVEPQVDLPEGLNLALELDGQTYPFVLVDPTSERTMFQQNVEITTGQPLAPGADSRGLVLSRRYLRSQRIPPEREAALVGQQAILRVEAPQSRPAGDGGLCPGDPAHQLAEGRHAGLAGSERARVQRHHAPGAARPGESHLRPR